MKQDHNRTRFAGRGYYIALIACIAAVGISGYVFVKTARQSALETMAPAVSAQTEESAAPAPSETPGAARKDPMEDAYEDAFGDGGEAPGEEALEETMGQAVLEPPAEEAVLWPMEGEVQAVFSRDALTYSQTMADWRTHEGLDIAGAPGDVVLAAQAGTVTAVYEDDYLGTVVVVSHSGDLATRYANLEAEPVVAVGDQVLAGEPLGRIGDTALLETAEPSHLHFEVYENGVPVDPLGYLPETAD